MGNTIKEEFEEYLRNLVDEITENILLDDMQKLYDNYSTGFSEFKETATLAKQTEQENREKIETEINEFQNLQNQIKSMMKIVDHALDLMNGGYKDVFANFSERVIQLNEDQKEALVQDINHTYEQKIIKLQKALGEYQASLIKELKENFDTDQLKIYTVQMQSVVEAVEYAVDRINQEYHQFFSTYSSDVQAMNQEERSKFTKEVKAVIQKEHKDIELAVRRMNQDYYAELSKLIPANQLECLENSLQVGNTKIEQLQNSSDSGQKRIEEAIMTSAKEESEKMDEINASLSGIKKCLNDQCELMKSNEEQSTLRLNDLQQELNQEREKNNKIKRGFMVMNGATLILLSYLFLMLEPWTNVRTEKAIGLTLALLPFVIAGGVYLRKSQKNVISQYAVENKVNGKL